MSILLDLFSTLENIKQVIIYLYTKVKITKIKNPGILISKLLLGKNQLLITNNLTQKQSTRIINLTKYKYLLIWK